MVTLFEKVFSKQNKSKENINDLFFKISTRKGLDFLQNYYLYFI